MVRAEAGRLQARLQRLSQQALAEKRLGIEKESLRVEWSGQLAKTAHPAALGSALTHPYITTDYSEALIELVTPPARHSWEALQFLVDLHQFVYANIGDEMLWATSMPCTVSRDEDIPLAWYGTSNVGTMKHVYRRGLGYRYGRLMQAIAGVHFNFSVGAPFWQELLGPQRAADAAEISARYFGLLRNFRRYGWLTLYLFGASPALCRSFLGGADPGDLEEFDGTLFGAHATSLRMSDVGYKNKVQSRLEIPVNDIDEYIAGLTRATETPYEPYQRLGVLVDGEWRQLNANMLQIENEYYSLVRPKRVARSGEKPTHALRRGGVEYVEVRALDVSPFDPAGVNQQQIRFLETMLVYCLLADSPPVDEAEQQCIDRNQLAVARYGRDPALRLERRGRQVPLRAWAEQLCEQMLPVAALCDDDRGSHTRAVEQQLAAVRDPSLTPSARVLASMRGNGESFFAFALRVSRLHRDYFAALAQLPPERQEQFDSLAHESRQRQAGIEAADTIGFGEFLARYFAQ